MLSALYLTSLIIALLYVVVARTIDVDFKTTVSLGASVVVNKTNTLSDTICIEIAPDALSSGSSVTLSVSFGGNNLTSLVLVSDRDVTFKVNDDGTPDLTVSMTANIPYIWRNDSELTNPLAGVTVTSFKFTNASGADATITGAVQCH